MVELIRHDITDRMHIVLHADHILQIEEFGISAFFFLKNIEY